MSTQVQLKILHSEPRKTADEIEDALTSFPNDLRHFLAAHDAEVSHDKMRRTVNSIFVAIATTETEQQVDDAVKRCVNSFDLFGNKLEQI